MYGWGGVTGVCTRDDWHAVKGSNSSSQSIFGSLWNRAFVIFLKTINGMSAFGLGAFLFLLPLIRRCS
jgi:hypothetical protein